MNRNRLAKHPPMGWNSWDCYGASVTEKEVMGNAMYMAEHLKDFGWEYIVVDIQWYEPKAKSSVYRPFAPLKMDDYGRLLPAENRFPSSKNGKGFKPLADYIHELGLKFGIHILRGIPRQAVHQNLRIKDGTAYAREIAKPNSICPWNTDMYGLRSDHEGVQNYYNSLFNLYASWGVDFIKVDDIAYSNHYGTHVEEIKMIRKAIDQCGRDMVLSLSPGPAPLAHGPLFSERSNMWRITDDFWDSWAMLYDMFERCNEWSSYSNPGSWPDADMLPLGHIGIRSVDGNGGDRWTRLTKDEQRTLLTLWVIFRSPLMFGGELRDIDEWTYSLLTHSEVLKIHRESYGAKQVTRNGDFIIWKSFGPEDAIYLAIFNAGEQKIKTKVPYGEVGLERNDINRIKDVWKCKEIQDEATLELEPHASVLLHVEK